MYVNRKVEVHSDGKGYVVFGSGNSCDLGREGETALIRWVEELYVRGWPPDWGDVHAAAKNIARSQGISWFSFWKVCKTRL